MPRSIIRVVLILLLLIGAITEGTCFAISTVSPALGQLPSIPSPTAQSSSLPPGVRRLGAIETAPITLDGRQLFIIGSPTVTNRANPGGQVPVEVRAQQIQDNLDRIVGNSNLQVSLREGIQSNTAYDPQTLQVDIATLNGATGIFVRDQNHPQLFPLLTVTQADSQAWGMPIDQVANSMRDTLNQRLRQALQERSPDRIREQISKAVAIGAGIVGGSLLLRLAQRFLKFRERILKQHQDAAKAQSSQIADQTREADPEIKRSTLLRDRKRQSHLERRRSIITLLKWLVFWGQVLLWGGGVLLILSLFPWTKPLSWDLLRLPIELLGIWFGVGLLNRIGDALLNLLERFWNRYPLLATEDEQRVSLRVTTTISALRGLKIAFIYLIAALLLLTILGAPTGSILAISGLIVVAISFSFQSLIKDLVTGILILWEDQFAIGDVIEILNTNGKQSCGLVENVNLRITQIRNDEGGLITIPNSSIVQVENMTRTWSRVDFSIELPPNTNIDRTLTTIKDVAQTLFNDPVWRDQILEPPEVLGVDKISQTGILIRAWIKTKPAQQWRVGREFRRRVGIALS